MKTLIFLSLMLLAPSLYTFAGELGLPAQDIKFKEFEQHGNLFHIKIIPGSKETKLYLVGKEKATIKFDKVSVFGKLKMGDSEKVIEFKKDKDYFTTHEELHGGSLYLNAKDNESQKSEDFKIDLKKP